MQHLLRPFLLALLGASALVCNLQAEQIQSIPAEFQGTWTWNKNGIHAGGEGPLRISSGEINAHETFGRVTRVMRSDKDKKTCVVSLDAASEGMEGKEKVTLTLSPDGRRLTLAQPNVNTCAFGAGVYYRAR